MKAYYNVTTKLKELLESEPFTNSVTLGHKDDVTANKITTFPVAHIEVLQAPITSSTVTIQINLKCFDHRDINKSQAEDDFIQNDNEQDVYNTQLAVVNRLFSALKRGEDSHLFQIEDTITPTPLIEYQEQRCAGWEVTFSITTPNDMTVC